MAVFGTPESAQTLIDHVFEIWVWPEVRRRDLSLSRADVCKLFVELEPGSAPRILLNEEAQLEASFTPKRSIAEGEEVTVEDIEHITELRPVSVGPNSGWLVLARLGHQEMVSFDFRYNRAKGAAVIKRAREFLTAAEMTSDMSNAVALDLAFSAAELAVHGQMMSTQSNVSNHHGRARWLAQWARNGNAPRSHTDLLNNLADLRSSARYGEGELRLRADRISRILRTVEEMVSSAEELIEPDAR